MLCVGVVEDVLWEIVLCTVEEEVGNCEFGGRGAVWAGWWWLVVI